MTIPDFQALMLPLLKFAADGKEYGNREVVEALGREFGLGERELKEMLPSGQQRIFDNRVAWVRAYLKMARLLENPRRGVFVITPRGREVVAENPPRVDLQFLRRFPEYLEWCEGRKEQRPVGATSAKTVAADRETKTPAEQLEEVYAGMRENLTNESPEQLKAAPPTFFEQVVVDLLVRMGYGGSRADAGQAIGRSNDEEIDGIIKEDRLGLDIIYLQAKRRENTVSRPEIQKFSGALQGKRARKRIFITTSDFPQGAQEYAGAIENKIILINGRRLTQYMIRGIAVDVYGLEVKGTVGILAEAKRRGLIESLRPMLLILKSSGDFIADSIIDAACRSVGES